MMKTTLEVDFPNGHLEAALLTCGSAVNTQRLDVCINRAYKVLDIAEDLHESGVGKTITELSDTRVGYQEFHGLRVVNQHYIAGFRRIRFSYDSTKSYTETYEVSIMEDL